jgi:hypothetical protein
LGLLFALAVTPVFAAAPYDKAEKTAACELRLRIPAAAMAIAPLKAELFRRWNNDSGNIKSEAAQDKSEMPQFFHAYALDTNWRVTFESARLISLSGNSYIDENGAHPNAAFDSVVWDKTTNRPVPFEALFVKGQQAAAFKAIAAAARKTWIATVNKESGGEPVDPSMTKEGIGDDAKHLGHYALTYAKGETKANGIVLLYGAGEAWAHVMGDFRLGVPVNVFRKYLAPEWAAEFK